MTTKLFVKTVNNSGIYSFKKKTQNNATLLCYPLLSVDFFYLYANLFQYLGQNHYNIIKPITNKF